MHNKQPTNAIDMQTYAQSNADKAAFYAWIRNQQIFQHIHITLDDERKYYLVWKAACMYRDIKQGD